MYVCHVCGAQFVSIRLIKSHLMFGPHQLHVLSSFSCRQGVCRMRFNTMKSYILHLTKVHSGDAGDAPVVNPNPEVEIQVQPPNVMGHIVHQNLPNVIEGNPIHYIEDNLNDAQDHFHEDDIDPPPDVPMEEYIRLVCRNSAVLAASLSAVPNINRKNVTLFLSHVSDFMQCGIVTALKDKVTHLFNLCDNADIVAEVAEVKSMFDILSDPFESVLTEYKRLDGAKEDGHYIPPNSYVLYHKDKMVNKDGEITLIREPATGQTIDLRCVFKYFFEIPLMFGAVTEYVDSLLHDKSVVENFVQGDLWQEILRDYDGKIVFPLHLHFDDYESNNVLGSHAGDQSLGALYASVPCLPPYLQKCVKNMFLTALFLTKDRKEATNLVTFGTVIDLLIELKETGVVLNLPQGEVRVFFVFCLIVADNKGSNAIQGVVDSFRSYYYCRICKMHRDIAAFSSSIPDNLLRNPVNYDADLTVADYQQTGLVENCVWNRVPGYHVTSNINCDVLHDVYEALVQFSLSSILLYFIRDRGYFDLETLHDRIRCFDFGPAEQGNKPPISHITMDRLQADNLNLAGNEMLCLGRYLGEIIGDLVPLNNSHWDLYILVREILLIVNCPYYSPGTEVYLGTVIQEHHEKFLQLTNKRLKPRHHLLLHYPACMKRNGPLVDCCTLTSERKHRQGKLYARSMNSRVNLPLSVAIKTQLQLSDHLLKVGDKLLNPEAGVNLVSHRKEILRLLTSYEMFAHLLPFNGDQFVSTAQSVEIYGTAYRVGMIIVVGVSGLYPTFAKIVHIISQNSSDFRFVLNLKNSVSYHDHYGAFEVANTDSFISLSHQDFISYVPLWERLSVHGKQFISLRNSL